MTAILPNCWSESDREAIRDQLDRILKSALFNQSRRRQRFLEYIVNEALAGRGERLKGHNIALAVFDRTETFDPNIDRVVRMEAGRLRDRLREYYETDGRDDPVRFELRPRRSNSTRPMRAREWWPPPHTSSPNSSTCSRAKQIRLWRLPPTTQKSLPRSRA